MAPIVLIGFMGSGKTTLGRRLAEVLGVDFVDLDTELETAQGCDIGRLMARLGEPVFRDLEFDLLRRYVTGRPADCVVATGGGIVENAAARALLPRWGRVVWLRADPDVCVERLGAARATRPLLADDGVWRPRYAQRVPLYAETAEFVVDTHPHGVDSCLRTLLGWLERAPVRGA